MVRVGSGQKFDPNSPISNVMLDTVIKQKTGNPLNEADVKYKFIALILFMKLFNIYYCLISDKVNQTICSCILIRKILKMKYL